MQNFATKALSSIFIIVLIISLLFIPYETNNRNSLDQPNFIAATGAGLNSKLFLWPIPGYTYISSHYGKRVSPTKGASSFHYGIDIPAPQGTPLISISDAEVIFCSWGIGGGYTVTLKLLDFKDMKVSYCHMDPDFKISLHEHISKGTIIGYVGPKNIYNIINNPYKDSNGKPTNGATTGTHLHFSIRKEGRNIDPLEYYY